MKNKIIISIVIMLLILSITGCTSKNKIMSCTNEYIEYNGNKTKEEVILTYNNKRVLKIKDIITYEVNPDFMEYYLNKFEESIKTYNDIKGIDVSYEKMNNNKIKSITKINYEEIEEENIKKILGDSYDKDGAGIYTTNKLTIEEYKNKYLEDYTCK